MLLLCGGLVNGPYALITTAVSADLVRPEASWEAHCFMFPPSVKLEQIIQHELQVFGGLKTIMFLYS